MAPSLGRSSTLLERLALAPEVGKRIEGHTAGANREKVAVLAPRPGSRRIMSPHRRERRSIARATCWR